MICQFRDRIYSLNQVEFERALRAARDSTPAAFFETMEGTRVDYNFNAIGPLIAWQYLKSIEEVKEGVNKRRFKRGS
jgi:hypothetical protein